MSTYPDLAAENAELRARLAEAEETIEAIRSGAVDALVTAGPAGEQVFTLRGAETPYRLLMESMNEGAATVARDGTVLYCNTRFAEMAGLPAEQVVGSSLSGCVVPEQQPALREIVAQTLPTGTKAEFTLASGPGLPALLSLCPLPMDPGLIALVATDLSERKHFERKLHQLNEELEQRVRERTAELQAIFDTAPIGLAITQDPKGRSIRGNPAIEKALGLGRGAEISRSAAQPPPYRCLQGGRELTAEQLPMQRAARGETITGYLMDIVRSDGASLTLHCNVAPLLDNQGRPRGAVGGFLDITERKQAEEALQRIEEERKVAEAVQFERQRLQEVLNLLPAYVVLLSPDHQVPFANRFFEERFGKSEGQHCYEYLFNRTEPCESCESFKVFGSNAPHHWEWVGPDGRNYDIYDFPFRDVDGSTLVMEVGLDITDRKKAEAELSRHREHLQELVQERTAELHASNEELTRFNQAMVGRELRMIELKQEINVLCARLSQPPPYPQAEEAKAKG